MHKGCRRLPRAACHGLTRGAYRTALLLMLASRLGGCDAVWPPLAPPSPSPPPSPAPPFGCKMGARGGALYRGGASVTGCGLECQNWTSQTPHTHEYTPNNYPDSGLGDHNFCRNPSGDAQPWCYTISASVEWQSCSQIPDCPNAPRGFLKTAVQAYNANATSAIATYGPITDWDVSAVSDMSGLFFGLYDFNADISSWNTSGVTDMSFMFHVRSARALPQAFTTRQ